MEKKFILRYTLLISVHLKEKVQESKKKGLLCKVAWPLFKNLYANFK